MEKTAANSKLLEIEEQGKRLRRRQDHLKEERDFLIDVMLTKPYREMHEHYKLLAEWEAEIDDLERGLERLRKEYKELYQKQPIKK